MSRRSISRKTASQRWNTFISFEFRAKIILKFLAKFCSQGYQIFLRSFGGKLWEKFLEKYGFSNFWLESGLHFHGLQAKKVRVFCEKPFRDCCQNWSPRFHEILSEQKVKGNTYQFLFFRPLAKFFRMIGVFWCFDGWFAKTAFKGSREKFWREEGFQKNAEDLQGFGRNS